MSRKTDAVVARTIGIDTGKNTLNLIGLDDKGSDRFAREAHSRPDRGTACDSDQALRHRFRSGTSAHSREFSR